MMMMRRRRTARRRRNEGSGAFFSGNMSPTLFEILYKIYEGPKIYQKLSRPPSIFYKSTEHPADWHEFEISRITTKTSTGGWATGLSMAEVPGAQPPRSMHRWPGKAGDFVNDGMDLQGLSQQEVVRGADEWGEEKGGVGEGGGQEEEEGDGGGG